MGKMTLCANGHFRLAIGEVCIDRRDSKPSFVIKGLATIELPGTFAMFFEKRDSKGKSLLRVCENTKFYSGSDYKGRYPSLKELKIPTDKPKSFNFTIEIPDDSAGDKLTLVAQHTPPKGYSWEPVSVYKTLRIPQLKILKNAHRLPAFS